MTTSHESPPGSHSPSSFQLSINDVDDFARLFPGWSGRFQQISAGPFHGEIQVVEGQLIRLFRATTNQVLLTRGCGHSGTIDMTPVTIRNQGSLWRGRQAQPSHVIFRSDRVGIDNLAARDAEMITFSIPVSLFKRAAANALPTDIDTNRISWGCNQVEKCSFTALGDIAHELMKSALFNPASLLTAESLAREEECLLAVLSAMACSTPMKRRSMRGNRADIVRRGEEYLRDHLASPIGLMDLCDEIGSSARTVQYAFRERFGIGPIEYLRMLRLDEVRRDLKSEDRNRPRIQEVAGRWGFTHLGNFAADYRKHFGELPSKTAKSRTR